MNEVDKYILNFKGLLMNNDSVQGSFFNTVLFNEQVFFKNLKELAKELYESTGSPVLTQEQIVSVTNQSKADTVGEILRELAKTNLFFNTVEEETQEPYIGVTVHGKLISEILLHDYKKIKTYETFSWYSN